MRILVTGAAGFIGSHLAERLDSLGHDVVGIDCYSDYYSVSLKRRNADVLAARGVQVVRLDLAEDDLEAAMRGTDAVYHLAAQPGISASVSVERYVRNNIIATHRLAEAARRLPSLQAFVYASSSSVYGAHAVSNESEAPQPTSPYGVTKLAAEQLALAHHRETGFPACALRLFSVYGERERPEKLYPTLMRSIQEDQPFPLYSGSEDHVRSFTYVGDIINGLVAVLDRLGVCLGEIINLGSPEGITTGHGIKIVEALLGREARIAHLPRRAGDQLSTRADIAKARRLLSYSPSTRPEDGLRAEVEWFLSECAGTQS